MLGLRRSILLAVCVALLAPIGAARADGHLLIENGTAFVYIAAGDTGDVSIGSRGITRDWDREFLNGRRFYISDHFGPTHDRRPDFSLQLGGVVVTSAALDLVGVSGERIDGGVRLTWDLSLPGAMEVTRTIEAYDGVGVLQARTILRPLVPLALSAYTLDEVHVSGVRASATAHAFRAGADWRYDEGWDPVGIGDDHRGHWRETTSDEQLTVNGEWLTVDFFNFDGHRFLSTGMVMERRNAASSMVSWANSVMSVGVDLSRDIVYGGPFEESIHAENPLPPASQQDLATLVRTPQPGVRARTLLPGRPLELERVVTMLGDNDRMAWEYYKYLTRHRMTPYPKAVTFNTNGVDRNAISTGAKDDVDFARLQTLADAAREMGVETFILDDGWQARSGDWCPDSPQCPEPRWDGVDMRFAPRFPDDEFRAVREVLAGDPEDPSDDMALGLWMTPMEFHPTSDAFMQNPQWSCAPVGTATALPSYADGGGSLDAGIGVWNPRALGFHPDSGEPLRLSRYIEDRIRRAIDVYGARYFKFDFLVWIDCLGIEPVDMYGYHDEFVAMLDRLQATYPNVTFSIDETNDYRLFPFESVARGPSWFQNGKPRTEQLLHNVWNLAPFVPGWSLGQHAASNDAERAAKGVDAVMAASLLQHITFWNEIDAAITPAERVRIRRWTDFYKQHRDTLAGFTLPLLQDPLDNDWTALQPWDLDEQRGWLLAYRQDGADAMRTIPLRAVDGDATFRLTLHDPGEGTTTDLGTVGGEQLLAGLDVTIAQQQGSALIQIERV